MNEINPDVIWRIAEVGGGALLAIGAMQQKIANAYREGKAANRRLDELERNLEARREKDISFQAGALGDIRHLQGEVIRLRDVNHKSGNKDNVVVGNLEHIIDLLTDGKGKD